MKAPPGGFNDSALTQIFQKTIPRIEDSALNTTTPSSKTNGTNGASGTGGQSPASSPSSSSPASSTPVGAIAGGVVGGVAALAITGALLYVFYFRRRRREKQAAGAAAAANQWGKPELSTHASVSRNRHTIHEVHGDHRPNEIDGNGFVEAPARDPARPPPVFEMASSNH